MKEISAFAVPMQGDSDDNDNDAMILFDDYTKMMLVRWRRFASWCKRTPQYETFVAHFQMESKVSFLLPRSMV